ncbi:MAG: glycosyltransferase, partial [Candidatus Bathyarchaeota archaeon]
MIVETTAAIASILFLFYSGYFLAMWQLSKRAKPALNFVGGDYRPLVSVVVPTYNEEDTIVRKLKNVAGQSYSNIEIIIVDSASQDRTIDLIEQWMATIRDTDFRVKLIRESERKGKASALNTAFKCCSGEIVVMTDADAIWRNDTLGTAISNFADPNVGAVTGRQVLLNPNQSLATRVERTYRSIYEVLRIGESVADSTPIFHGEISCFRRSLLESVREDSMADDSELAVKVRKQGFKSIYDPNAIFYEHAPPTFGSRLTQKLRRGQGLIQLFLRERKILFNRKYQKYGVLVFPAEFFMHLISPLLVLTFLAFFFYTLFLIDSRLALALCVIFLALPAISTLTKMSLVSLPLSFLNSQLILLLSLVYQMLGRSQHKWAKITAVREL